MAGTPWLDTQDAITEGSGYMIVSLCCMPSTTIASFGTGIKFTISENEHVKFANSVASSTEYITQALSTGNTIRKAKAGITMDATTGTQVSTDTAAADELVGTLTVPADEYANIIAMYRSGAPVLGCIGNGITADGANVGNTYLLGKLSGDFEHDIKEEFAKFTMTIKGGVSYTLTSGVTYTNMNTAMGSTIEPVGKSTVTLVTLATGDQTSVLAGQATFKATP